MGERRKTLKIWMKRTRDRGVVEGTRLEAKDVKKYRRPKTALSRTDLFYRKDTGASVLQKKIVIIRSSNSFFTRFKKKCLKFFQVISKNKIKTSPKKTNFSTKNDLQNFKDSKNTAVLELRTAIFENLKL